MASQAGSPSFPALPPWPSPHSLKLQTNWRWALTSGTWAETDGERWPAGHGGQRGAESAAKPRPSQPMALASSPLSHSHSMLLSIPLCLQCHPTPNPAELC